MKKRKKKINWKLVIIILIFLIILLNFFSNNILPKLIKVASLNVKEQTLSTITDAINDYILENDFDELLELNKNSKGEIIYAKYNMIKTYKVLKDVTYLINNNLRTIENFIYLPLGMASKNIFIQNLGPKIPFKLDFYDGVLTRLQTKVTNYGLNNALVEIYLVVDAKSEIIVPYVKKSQKYQYKTLLSSYLISGSVPGIYGGAYDLNSKIYDENLIE